MAEIPADALRQVISALGRYETEVNASKLRPSAARTYLLHARNFVRWLKGDFTPGATL